MTQEEYNNAPGLSQSGMKDLAISPLHYWFRHVNPERVPEEPIPAMTFGSALHCSVLESPETFAGRYFCETSADDYPGCLVTIQDLRQWLNDKGHMPKGTRKDDVIRQVQAVEPNWPILDVIERRNLAQNKGKQMLKKYDWDRVGCCSAALMEEPYIRKMLAEGEPEVPMFAIDPETGVQLKCRLDWKARSRIGDLKTFTQRNGRSIDESIHDAIWYERYFRQAWLYRGVRQIAEPGWRGDFVMAFVESEPPFEVRIKALGPGHLYWDVARIEAQHLIGVYADNVKEFGEKPWRYAQQITPLVDEEMKQLAYA